MKDRHKPPHGGINLVEVLCKESGDRSGAKECVGSWRGLRTGVEVECRRLTVRRGGRVGDSMGRVDQSACERDMVMVAERPD